jgi:exopolysaccharide biosynthesis polyprenyl glycosylphosphotransferase
LELLLSKGGRPLETARRRSNRWRLRAGERRLLLIGGDLVAASAATFLALALWSARDWLGFSMEFVQGRAAWFVLLPPGWLLLMVNMYDLRRANSFRETLRGVLAAAAGGLVVYLVVYFSSEPGSLNRRGMLYFLVFAILLTLAWRWIFSRIFAAPAFMRRVLIVGAGQSAKDLLSVVSGIWPPPFHLVGLVDDDTSKKGRRIKRVPVIGDSSDLSEAIEREAISDIIVAISGPMNGKMFQALLDAQERGVEITRMPVAYEELLGRLPIKHLESDWLLRSFVDELRVSGTYVLGKRLVDFAGSIVGLLLLTLLLPLISLAVILESGNPVLFSQMRMGQGGRLIRLFKFRTMSKDAEADGQARWTDAVDPRMTRIGRILRKTHLDEFPQFWNVLKGEMSLVGPRPERPEFVSQLVRQVPFYRARLLVKPGVSGWAQVNGGKGASVEGTREKLEYDLYYIKHRSLWMDLWIILRSIGSAAGLRGV